MDFFKKYGRWILTAWIAFVFLQSLFFKFGNSLETQHIFGTLGAFFGLPWFADLGGYLVGVAELIAVILMLTPVWVIGAWLSLGIMTGAILFHLFTPLGIVMPAFVDGQQMGDDGGTLFVMACITWLSALILVIIDWRSPGSLIRGVLSRG